MCPFTLIIFAVLASLLGGGTFDISALLNGVLGQ